MAILDIVVCISLPLFLRQPIFEKGKKLGVEFIWGGLPLILIELMIEFMFHFIFILQLVLVGLFEIFCQNNISVFSYRDHTSFLADGMNISTGNLVRSSNKVFQIDIIG